MAYDKKEMNLIQDLYSPTMNLEFSQKRISTSNNKYETTKNFTVNDKIQIPGIEDGHLLDVEVAPDLANTKITNSKIIYSGELNLNFIFTNANTLNSRNAKVPFEFSVDNTEKTDKINAQAYLSVGDTSFEVNANGEVDAKIDVEVLTKISKNMNINIIDNIEALDDPNDDTDEDYNSLILYIVQPGDTLWTIAKRFNSTVEELGKMNGIEDVDKIQIGQKIYIPKFNHIRKENTNNEPEQVFV